MKHDYNNQLNIRLRISEKNKSSWIEIENISYLICEGYLTRVHLICSKTFTCSMLLKQFEEILAEFGFIRANRNTLVNYRHVNCLIFKKGKRSIFVNNFEIKVSRRRAFLFKRK